MSSRELLDELLGVVTATDNDGATYLASAGFLPEQSAVNTALRGGDSSPQEYRQGRIINELASGRADGRGYTPNMWRSHAELAAENAHAAWKKRRHDETLAQLRGRKAVNKVAH